jgi:carboxymethylenebutenolidase
MHVRRLAVLVCAVSGFGQPLWHKTTTFHSRRGRATIEEYASRAPTTDAAAVILLCGSGGVQSSAVPYADEARLFAHTGYRVYLPHYLDVTRGHASDPEMHYGIWAQTVRDALQYIQSEADIPPSRTAIVGYSLGGSVALSVAAMESHLAGVVVWSGSLPDAYRDVEMLPPLLILHGTRDSVIPVDNARQLAALCTIKHLGCDLSIYYEEGHAFSAAGLTRANREIQAFLDTVLRPR